MRNLVGGASRRRLPSRERFARAWRRNRARLSFPHSLADRLLRPDARPDGRLALSLLHRLRPLDPGALGRAEELRIRVLPGRAARQRAFGHASLRRLVDPAEADGRAGACHGARSRHSRRCRLSRHLLSAVAARRVSRDRDPVAADFRQRRPDQSAPAPDAWRQSDPAGLLTPITPCGRWSCWRSGSSARR